MKGSLHSDSDALFNDMAHEVIRKVLNVAEDKLLQAQIEDPVEVEEYICRFFIEECAGMIEGASCFTQVDATLGAENFLMKCLGGFSERPHRLYRTLTPPKLRACGTQLSYHSSYYFPRYRAILTQRYIEELQKPDHAVLVGAGFNGVFHLAAASLPGVEEEINRELRRRGLNHDAAKVPASDLARRKRANGQPKLLDQGKLQ